MRRRRPAQFRPPLGRQRRDARGPPGDFTDRSPTPRPAGGRRPGRGGRMTRTTSRRQAWRTASRLRDAPPSRRQPALASFVFLCLSVSPFSPSPGTCRERSREVVGQSPNLGKRKGGPRPPRGPRPGIPGAQGRCHRARRPARVVGPVSSRCADGSGSDPIPESRSPLPTCTSDDRGVIGRTRPDPEERAASRWHRATVRRRTER